MAAPEEDEEDQELIAAGESRAQPLIDALLSQGRLVRQGAFTLHEEQASHKLARYQLADPHAYVLELVCAAHLMGASWMTVRAGLGWLEARWDGDVPDAQALERVFAAAFARRLGARERALRHLAFALHAAQGLGLRYITARSVSEHGAAQLVLSGQPALARRVERLERPEDRDEAPRGMTLIVRKRLSAQRVREASAALVDELPELALLRRRCALASMLIVVNGRRVSHGLEASLDVEGAGTCLARVPIRSAWERGVLVLRPEAMPSQVSVMQHGVLVSEHALALEGVSARVVVDSRRLSKNLSQSAFVEDEAWRALWDEVIMAALHEAALQWLGQALSQPQAWPSGLERAARALIAQIGELRERRAPLARATLALGQALERLALWPLGDDLAGSGAQGSMAQLGVGLLRDGPLLITRQRHRDVRLSPERRVMFAAPAQVALLERYLGQRAQDVTQALEDEALRQANEARWRAQPPEQEPQVWDADAFLAYAQVELPEGRVSVGLRRGGLMHSELRVIKQGRLLRAKELRACPIPRLVVRWSGDLEPDARFEDARQDARYARAMLAATALALQLVADSPAGGGTHERLARRDERAAQPVDERVLSATLEALLSGQLIEAMLHGLTAQASWLEPEALRAWVERGQAQGWPGLALLALMRQPPEDLDALERAVAQLGGLGRHPWIETLHEAPLSLVKLVELVRAQGVVPYIEHERRYERLEIVGRPSWALGHPVVALTPRGLEAMARLFGASRLRHSGASLLSASNRQRFMAQRAHAVALSPRHGRFLQVASLQDAALGVQGQLGLQGELEPPRGAGLGGGQLVVHVFVQGRALVTKHLALGFGRAVACVQGQALTPQVSWGDVREDAAWEALVRHMLRALEGLMLEQVARVSASPQRDGLSLGLVWGWLLDAVVSGVALAPGHGQRLAAALERSPLFALHDEPRPLSLAKALERWSQEDHVRWTHEPHGSLRAEAPRPQDPTPEATPEATLEATRLRAVLCVPASLPQGHAQALLERLFWQKYQVSSLRVLAQDARQLERSLSAYLARDRVELGSVMDQPGALLSWQASRGDEPLRAVRVEVAAAGRSALEIVVLHQGRAAMTRQVRRRWWRARVWLEAPALIDWSRSEQPDEAQVVEVMRQAHALEREAILRAVEALREQPEDMDAARRSELLEAMWLARFTSPERPDEEPEQDEALLALPCVRVREADQALERLVSLAQLERAASQAGGELRFALQEWQSSEAQSSEAQSSGAQSSGPLVVLSGLAEYKALRALLAPGLLRSAREGGPRGWPRGVSQDEPRDEAALHGAHEEAYEAAYEAAHVHEQGSCVVEALAATLWRALEPLEEASWWRERLDRLRPGWGASALGLCVWDQGQWLVQLDHPWIAAWRGAPERASASALTRMIASSLTCALASERPQGAAQAVEALLGLAWPGGEVVAG